MTHGASRTIITYVRHWVLLRLGDSPTCFTFTQTRIDIFTNYLPEIVLKKCKLIETNLKHNCKLLNFKRLKQFAANFLLQIDSSTVFIMYFNYRFLIAWSICLFLKFMFAMWWIVAMVWRLSVNITLSESRSKSVRPLNHRPNSNFTNVLSS